MIELPRCMYSIFLCLLHARKFCLQFTYVSSYVCEQLIVAMVPVVQ